MAKDISNPADDTDFHENNFHENMDNKLWPDIKSRHIITDINNIYVKDYEWSDELLDLLRTQKVPWQKTIMKNYTIDNGYLNILYAYSLGYLNPKNPKWVYIINTMVKEFVKDIDRDAKFISLERLHACEYINDGVMRCHDIHQDQYIFDDNWTILVHVYGSSGDTVFYKNMNIPEVVLSVPFRPGRMLLYPSVYAHKGNLPTDTNKRCILNYIYKIDTKLRDKVKISK